MTLYGLECADVSLRIYSLSLTCKNRLPYNLYCVGGDVKHCTIQSVRQTNNRMITGLFYTYRWIHFTSGNASFLWYLSVVCNCLGGLRVPAAMHLLDCVVIIADYDSPVAENGDLTEKYFIIQRVLADMLPSTGGPCHDSSSLSFLWLN